MAEKMISYAQNGEDVVLSRALRDVENGFYLDIGANDPAFLSVTKAFYDRGWSGVCVEPLPELARSFKEVRPRDDVVNAVISDSADERLTFYAIEGTGLSTLRPDIADQHRASGFQVEEIQTASIGMTELLEQRGHADREIHFAIIDTEGSEALVLRSFDFERTRPWVLVVESTAPTTTDETYSEWESLVVGAGYRFCLFDGLSRFYVDDRRHPELAVALSYPAGVFDAFIRAEDLERETRIGKLEKRQRELVAEVNLRDELIRAQKDMIDGFQSTLSWRLTRPLRAIRRILPHRP